MTRSPKTVLRNVVVSVGCLIVAFLVTVLIWAFRSPGQPLETWLKDRGAVIFLVALVLSVIAAAGLGLLG